MSFELREHPRDSHVFKNRISEIPIILLIYVSFSLTRKRDEDQHLAVTYKPCDFFAKELI